jgi:catechol 2,3-dioxygenase-like lactoylglutathione lyase family enzyme
LSQSKLQNGIDITGTAFQIQADNPLGLKPHHVSASVIDLDQAIKWYYELLGFQLLERRERANLKSAELRIPGNGIGMVQPRTPAHADAAVSTKPAWIHPVFADADPDKACRILKEEGANVVARGAEEGAPVSSFLVYDSEGNEIEILADTVK